MAGTMKNIEHVSDNTIEKLEIIIMIRLLRMIIIMITITDTTHKVQNTSYNIMGIEIIVIMMIIKIRMIIMMTTHFMI